MGPRSDLRTSELPLIKTAAKGVLGGKNMPSSSARISEGAAPLPMYIIERYLPTPSREVVGGAGLASANICLHPMAEVSHMAQETLEERRTVGESLLTVRDLARLLKMSERWVHERTRRREIPCYRFRDRAAF